MYIHMLAWCLFSRVLVETMLMLTSDDAMHYVLVYLHTREHGVFVSFYGSIHTRACTCTCIHTHL